MDEQETAASTGSTCTDGTESCPCIDGECLGELVCLSNVCVNAESTTGGMSRSSSTSGAAMSATISGEDTTDTGIDTTPPVTGDTSDDLPAGAPCDPTFDLCEFDLSCNGIDALGFYCDYPGPVDEGGLCLDPFECGYGLTCVPGTSFVECPDEQGCCTNFCDLFLPNPSDFCLPGYACEPYFPVLMRAPLPDYEHVGVCVQPRP